MSKKKNDQNFISELLGKLKASYSEPEKKTESKKSASKSQTADPEFQKQLEAMLSKASVSTMATEEAPVEAPQKESLEKQKPKKKKATPKKKPQKETPPTQEPARIPEDTLTEALEEVFVEEPVERIIEETQDVRVEEPVEEVIAEDPVIIQESEVVAEAETVEAPETVEESSVTEDPIPAPIEKATASDPKEATPSASRDPIVIRPKQSRRTQQETIVIRPRTQSRSTPAPQKVTESISQEPIRIGKEASQQVKTPTPVKKTRVTVKDAAPKEASTARATAVSEGQVKTTVSSAKSSEKTTPKASAVARTTVAKETISDTSSQAPIARDLEEKSVAEALENPSVPASEAEVAPAPDWEKGTAASTETKAENDRKQLSFEEQIHQKTGLNEEDVALLFELGYETELSNLVGAENLKKLKSAHLRKQRNTEKAEYPTSFGYRGKEYTGGEDQSGILASYIHDRKYLILRLILTALGALCLLFVEISALRSAYWTQIDQTMPWVLPVMGILLLIATAALSAKQIWEGAKALFRFSPLPYSVCSVLLLPALIYDVIAILINHLTHPINFLVSLAFLVTVACDVLRLCGELRVFRLLSEEGTKQVLESVALRKKKMKYGDKVVKILNDDVGKSFYRVSRSREITGFFRRFNTMQGASRPFAVLILSSMGLSLLLAFAVAILTKSLSEALSSFVISLLIGSPLSAVFSYFYPLFHANRILTHHRCALVGEESAEEYSQPKTVIFEDHDMFHTEKCTEIVLNESGDFQTDMKLASALFRKIGNTLDPVASARLEEEIPVTLIRISENGTEATANDRHLLAGDAAFLKKYGIRVPKESADRALRRTENVKVMYVAIDEALKISYEIEYTEKLTFEKMAEALLESNTSVAIRSYDPNLNTAFVQELQKAKSETVRVIKPGRYEDTGVHDLIDTGAFSLDSAEKTVCALHAAAKIEKTRKFTMRMQLIATLLGCGTTLLLAWLGDIDALGIPQILFYHVFWMLISLIATHTEINEEKLHLLK